MKLKPCIPEKLPLRDLKWECVVDLIGKAHATLARYESILERVKNPEIFFSDIADAEACASLQNKDERAIFHYRTALLIGMKEIGTKPLSFRLLKSLHREIKKDALIEKDKGHFRDRQNWIGPEGHGIEEAYFLPPEVTAMHKGMTNLKEYMSYSEKDPLVQLAIVFAQFLILHPFMDGNGRVARALVPLFLYKKKVMSTPMLFLSAYFKRHRLSYLEHLYDLRLKHAWENWIRFFLKGIIEEGIKSIQCAKLLTKKKQ